MVTGSHDQRPAAQLFHARGSLLGIAAVDVDDDDVGPALRHQKGVCAAHSIARTGDQRGTALELHGRGK